MRARVTVCLALLWPAQGIAQDEIIRVSEVTSSHGRSSAPFGSISDMVAMPDGRIVVTDDLNSTVWLWEPSSGGVARLARSGQGPGEVRTPTQVALRPEGGLALYDPGHSRVLFYDSALAFERAVLISGLVSNPKDLLLLDDGSFVLAGGRLSNTTQLQQYARDGSRLGEWGQPGPLLEDPHARIQVAGGALRSSGDETWLFASAAPYRVTRFASLGFDQPSLFAEDLELVPEATDEGLTQPLDNGAVAFRWWFDRITGLFEFAGGQVLTVVTRFYSGDSVWSLHGPTGELLGRTTVDQAYDVYDRVGPGLYVASYRDLVTDERVAVLLRVELGN